jgi:uncharacterized protein YciI
MVGELVFVVVSRAGKNRDLSKGTREQAFWDEHAAFIDNLVEEGFIVMGGPLVDEAGAMLIVRAESEEYIRETLRRDPWYENGILDLVSIKRWHIFIDRG